MRSNRRAQPLDDASDQELVALVRAGDPEAYATLWRRHSGPAYGVARTFTSLDADDLVSEAFAKVLGAIRAGGGPDRAFRPYITTTVRNIGRSLHVREAVLVDSDLEWRGTAVASGEAAAVEGWERSVALSAFHSLPVRWQEVLWYSEVDDLKVGTISTYLGIPANAVSALLIRAKRGLRDAWISAQLAAATTPECEATIRNLGAYARHRLSRRAAAKIEEHLATCARCRAAHAEAKRASSLILGLLPLVAGTAGAAGYAAHLSAPPMSVALAAVLAPQGAVAGGVGASVSAAPAAVGAAVALGAPATVGAAAGAGAGAVVLAAVAAVILVTNPTIVVPEPADRAPESMSVPAAPLPSTTTTLPPRSPLPTATPTPPSVTLPPSVPAPVSPAEPSPPPVSEPTPTPVPLSPVSPEPTPIPGGGNTRIAPLLAPPAELTQTDPRFYPYVSGDDARAGAKIRLFDGGGRLVGAGSADDTGSWQVLVVAGSSGRHDIRAVQIVGEETSPPGASMPVDVSPPPVIDEPANGDEVDATGMTLVLSVPGGSVLQREIVGVTPLETVRTPAGGEWRESVAVPRGWITIRVRYADTVTGDVGPYSEVTVYAR